MPAELNPPRPAHLLSGLTMRRVLWTTALAALSTALLVQTFTNSYLDLLVSALCVGYAIMLTFTIAGNLPVRRLPREAVQMLAVFIGAAVGTVLTIVVKGRPLSSIFHERLFGAILTSSSGIGIGCVIVGIYMYREQRARTQTELARAEADHQRLERQVLSAQMRLLQAQVEPHFLFNTLANVQHLVDTDVATAQKVLAALIRYLRAALPRMREERTTLGRELTMVSAYLEIQAARMGSRLRYSVDVPAALLDLALPPMMLISLVENAIKHGIDPLAEGGTVEIAAYRAGDALEVEVRDTGTGLAETAGIGIGLTNIRERLATLFERAGRLDLRENSPHGVVAVLSVPAVAAGAPQE